MAKKRKGMDFNLIGRAVGRAAGMGKRSVGAGARAGKKTMRKRSI